VCFITQIKIKEGYMCLVNIIDFKITKDEGYKVFRIKNGKPCGLYRSKNVQYKKNRWYKSTNKVIESYWANIRYKSGFHIYKNITSARDLKRDFRGDFPSGKFAIYKVQFKDVVAKGRESKGKVIVAKQMKLIEEVK
jgi:hypothetical protein